MRNSDKDIGNSQNQDPLFESSIDSEDGPLLEASGTPQTSPQNEVDRPPPDPDTMPCEFGPYVDPESLGDEHGTIIRRIKEGSYSEKQKKCIVKKLVKEGSYLEPEVLPDDSENSEVAIQKRLIEAMKIPYRLSLVDVGITPEFVAQERKKLFGAEAVKIFKVAGEISAGQTLPKGYSIVLKGEEETVLEYREKDNKTVATAVDSTEKIFHVPELKLKHSHDFHINSQIPEPDELPSEEEDSLCQ
jgi:hypothetical protein